MGSTRIDKLESLVDELVKETPREARIRACMEAAGLEYTSDPVVRMKSVLSALDGIRGFGMQAAPKAILKANLKDTRAK